MSPTVISGCQVRVWSLADPQSECVDLSDIQLELYQAEDNTCIKARLKEFSLLSLPTSFVWLDLPTTSFLSQQQSLKPAIYHIQLVKPVEVEVHVDNKLDLQHQADEVAMLHMYCRMMEFQLLKNSKIEITVPSSPTTAGLCHQFFDALNSPIKQGKLPSDDASLLPSIIQDPDHDVTITLTKDDLDSLEEIERSVQYKPGGPRSQPTAIHPPRKPRHHGYPPRANEHLRPMTAGPSYLHRSAETEQRLVDNFRKNQNLWKEINQPKGTSGPQEASISLPQSAGNAGEASRTRWVDFATSRGAPPQDIKSTQPLPANDMSYVEAYGGQRSTSGRATANWTLPYSASATRDRNKYRHPRALASMKPPTNFPSE